MNEWLKTSLVAFVAAGLVAAAILTVPKFRDAEVFQDEGRLFFPDFTDPLKVTSLEIVEYDEATATARPFKVEFKNNAWVIPSHNNYPADAKERLEKTAAAVIDLRKDSFRTDQVRDHELLGVIDPVDDTVTTPQGRGKRVTLRDEKGNVLADFVVGKSVGGGREMVYLRVPGQKRVYAVRTKAEISARFSDWIETDFLKVQSSEIRQVHFDIYHVDGFDPRKQTSNVRKIEEFLVEKKDDGKWTCDGAELTKTEAANDATTALADLKIVGVRPKPSSLTPELTLAPGTRLSNEAVAFLANRGFYPHKTENQVRLMANDGQIEIVTQKGVVYTLLFGEVIYGEGEAVTAGKEESDEKKDEEKKEEKPEGKENRYVMISVRFDVKWVPPPKADPRPDRADRYEDEPGLDAAARRAAMERRQKEDEEWEKKSEETLQQRKKEWDEKVKEGEKAAKDLNKRFAAWFYVIPGDSYKKLHLSKKDLLKP